MRIYLDFIHYLLTNSFNFWLWAVCTELGLVHNLHKIICFLHSFILKKKYWNIITTNLIGDVERLPPICKLLNFRNWILLLTQLPPRPSVQVQQTPDDLLRKVTRKSILLLDNVSESILNAKVHPEIGQSLGYRPTQVLIANGHQLLIGRPLALRLLNRLLEIERRQLEIFVRHTLDSQMRSFVQVSRRFEEDDILAARAKHFRDCFLEVLKIEIWVQIL